MKTYITNNKRVMSTDNWSERMGDITIEQFCEENGYVKFTAPDNIVMRMEYITNNKFDQSKYNARTALIDVLEELNDIIKWFEQNDWKVNKILLNEWPEGDVRRTEYLKEREQKRLRRDELNKLL